LDKARGIVQKISVRDLTANGANKRDCQLLHMAIIDKDLDSARRLAKKIKHDIEHLEDEVGSNDTARLYLAIKEGNAPLAHSLMIRVKQDMKDDPLKANNKQLGALYAAVMDGDMEMAQALLDKVWLDLGMEVTEAKDTHFKKMQQAIKDGDMNAASVLASRVKEDGGQSDKAILQSINRDLSMEEAQGNGLSTPAKSYWKKDVPGVPDTGPVAAMKNSYKSEAQAAAEATGMEEQYDPNPEQAKKEIKELIESIGYGKVKEANGLIKNIKLHVPGIEDNANIEKFFNAVKLGEIALARELGNQLVFVMMQLAEKASLDNVLVSSTNDETAGVVRKYQEEHQTLAPTTPPTPKPAENPNPSGGWTANPAKAKAAVQEFVEAIGYGRLAQADDLIKELKELIPGIEDHKEVATLFSAVEDGKQTEAHELANQNVFLLLRLAAQAGHEHKDWKEAETYAPSRAASASTDHEDEDELSRAKKYIGTTDEREPAASHVKDVVAKEHTQFDTAATPGEKAEELNKVVEAGIKASPGEVTLKETDTVVNASTVNKEIDINDIEEEAHETMYLMDDAIKRGDMDAVRRLGKRGQVVVALKTLKESHMPINVTHAEGDASSTSSTSRASGTGDTDESEDRAISPDASAMPSTYTKMCHVTVTADPEEMLQQLRSCTTSLGEFAKVVEGGRLTSRNSNALLQEELKQVGLLLAKVKDRRPVDAALNHDQQLASQFLLGELKRTEDVITKMRTDY